MSFFKSRQVSDPAAQINFEQLSQTLHIAGAGTAAAAGQVLTGAFADVTGCTVTVTSGGGKAFVVGIIDFTVTTAGVMAGQMLVDGVAQASQIILGGAVNDRGTAGQVWIPTLSSGSHTMKLQATAATGAGTINATHATISYLLLNG